MGEVMSDVKDILSEILRAQEENEMEQQERKSLYPISSNLSHRYVKGIILRSKKKTMLPSHHPITSDIS